MIADIPLNFSASVLLSPPWNGKSAAALPLTIFACLPICDTISINNLVKILFIWEETLEANELAHAAVEVAASKKADNILVLDMRGITLLADYFILCDGNSNRQIKAISDDMLDKLKWEGSRRAVIEGAPESGWVLIDFGSVIVHVFSPEQRAYYQLEELWKEAPIVVRML